MENLDKYKRVRNRAGFPPVTILATVAGAIGTGMFFYGLWLQLFQRADGSSAIVMGLFMALGLFPAFFRSGIEVDRHKRRFREFDGFLGRDKDDWLNIEDGDYLSIVGFSQGRGAKTKRASTFIYVAVSKVYFWSGDYHTEIFQGHYEDALKFAKRFGKELGLGINDVNKDQNTPGASMGSNRGAWHFGGPHV